MKRLILFIALMIPILLLGQQKQDYNYWASIGELPASGIPIFSIREGNVITDSRFLEEIPLEPRITESSYSLSSPVELAAGNAVYSIRTAKFIGWETEPGDFNVVEISREGKSIYLLKDPHGIYNARNSHHKWPFRYSKQFAQYADNDYCFTVPLSDSATALIFLGHPYGTGPARVYIFVLNAEGVTMVQNKSFVVRNMTKTPTTFTMTADRYSGKMINGVETNQPRTFTIWKKDGALWIKDN